MPARRKAFSSVRNPRGPTKCRTDPVAAHRRAIFPVLGGISGSTRTTWRGVGKGAARSLGAWLRAISRGRPRYAFRLPLRGNFTELDADWSGKVASPIRDLENAQTLPARDHRRFGFGLRATHPGRRRFHG